MSQYPEKALPFNIDAERATLGSCIIDPHAIQSLPFLQPEHFYRDSHRMIYRILADFARTGTPADYVTLCAELTRRGELETIGGTSEVTALINCTPSSANVVYHAQLVFDRWKERAHIHLATEMAGAAYDGDGTALARLRQKWDEIEQAAQSQAPKFQFIPASQVEALPPMEWLIGGIIPLEATSAMWGVEGVGKSFVILDMSCCIATGQAWRGHPVKKMGTIAYIAGEGMKGMALRIRAWREAHRLPLGAVDNLHMIGKAPQLLQQEDLEALLQALRALPQKPDLVIIDTLARSAAGADENGQKEMGMIVLAMDTIKQEFGAQVLTVHHANATGERMRGSTVLPGAFETIIRVAQQIEGLVQITCQKQKDGASKFAPIPLRLKQWIFPADPTLEHLSTCILVDVAKEEMEQALPSEPPDEKVWKILLRVLHTHGGKLGSTAWEKETKTLHEMSHGRFDGYRQALINKHYVFKPDGWQAPYEITEDGLHFIGKQSNQSKSVNDTFDRLADGSMSVSHISQWAVGHDNMTDWTDRGRVDDLHCVKCGKSVASLSIHPADGFPYCVQHLPPMPEE